MTLEVPETFDDVAVAFSEEEWKMLGKQEKELHREVMVQNYENMVSVGYNIPKEHLLLLLDGDRKFLCCEMQREETVQQKDHPEDYLSRAGFSVPEHFMTLIVKDEAPSVLESANRSETACHLPPDKSTIIKAEFPVPENYATLIAKDEEPSVYESMNRNETVHQQRPEESTMKISRTFHCSESWSQQSSLEKCLLSHITEKPHQYPQCEKNFHDLHLISVQQHIHKEQRQYQCTEYQMSFSRLNVVKYTDKSFTVQHNIITQQIHWGEKPYKCPDCDKSFKSQSSLVKHKRLHTGEKPYRCTECNKTFTVQSSLVTHQRIHTGRNHINVLTVTRVLNHRVAL